jgi:hypothetical protein
MELTKRINSDTTSSEFKQDLFLTSPCILQIRLGTQGSRSALSDADSSFVDVCCYETLQEWEGPDCALITKRSPSVER